MFNIGNEYGKQEWQNIFRQLITQNLLSVEAEHGGLKITQQGMEFLKAKNVISLRKYTAKTKTRKRKRHTQVFTVAPPEARSSYFSFHV